MSLILLTELIRNIPFPSEKLGALPCPVFRGVLLQTKAVPLLQKNKANVGLEQNVEPKKVKFLSKLAGDFVHEQVGSLRLCV